jgi:hypothetical protein
MSKHVRTPTSKKPNIHDILERLAVDTTGRSPQREDLVYQPFVPQTRQHSPTPRLVVLPVDGSSCHHADPSRVLVGTPNKPPAAFPSREQILRILACALAVCEEDEGADDYDSTVAEDTSSSSSCHARRRNNHAYSLNTNHESETSGYSSATLNNVVSRPLSPTAPTRLMGNRYHTTTGSIITSPDDKDDDDTPPFNPEV